MRRAVRERLADATLLDAEARMERQAADFAARDAEHAVELAAERDKAERARVELASIADRLALIVEDQRTSWWRRFMRAG